MSDNFHLGGKARRHRGPGVQQPSALSALWSTSCSVARMPTRHTQRPAAMPMTWAMRRYARVPGPAWRYRASGQRGGQSSREAFPERSRQAVALSFCCQQTVLSARVTCAFGCQPGSPVVWLSARPRSSRLSARPCSSASDTAACGSACFRLSARPPSSAARQAAARQRGCGVSQASILEAECGGDAKTSVVLAEDLGKGRADWVGSGLSLSLSLV